MTVYAKRITEKQKKCMEKYEAICGFEFMHQDDIDSGDMDFEEAWQTNIRWLEDLVAVVINIDTSESINEGWD